MDHKLRLLIHAARRDRTVLNALYAMKNYAVAEAGYTQAALTLQRAGRPTKGLVEGRPTTQRDADQAEMLRLNDHFTPGSFTWANGTYFPTPQFTERMGTLRLQQEADSIADNFSAITTHLEQTRDIAESAFEASPTLRGVGFDQVFELVRMNSGLLEQKLDAMNTGTGEAYRNVGLEPG